MSKVFIEESTLTSIGSAIREKTGKSDLIAPGEMPGEIRGIVSGGGADVEPIVLTGNCQYSCTGAIAGAYINMYGNTISTDKISDLSYMFKDYTGEVIPFDLNCVTTASVGSNSTFDNATKLKTLPKINNFKTQKMGYFFNNCYNLRTIPDDFTSNWDWSYFHTNYYGDYTKFFQNCYSLRSIPQALLNNLWSGGTTSSYVVNSMFYNCYVLDEINGLYVNEETEWKSNVFSNTFGNCYRLANLRFAVNEDGTPKIAKWKQQTIDLSMQQHIGYAMSYQHITAYNSGITTDKQVDDAEQYQALKNDADWYATYSEYSRYNHDSAVNTINSLPDTSAYLATAGGTNTIKFYGVLGSLTDGGAINTLTEAEIAVAAAKGWTVTL